MHIVLTVFVVLHSLCSVPLVSARRQTAAHQQLLAQVCGVVWCTGVLAC